MQLSIDHVPYDGRAKPKELLPKLESIISDPPCFACQRLRFKCSPETCDLLTEWSFGGKLNES